MFTPAKPTKLTLMYRLHHAILFPAANKASHQADHLDSDDQMKHAGRQSEANDCQELHKEIVKPAKMFHLLNPLTLVNRKKIKQQRGGILAQNFHLAVCRRRELGQNRLGTDFLDVVLQSL